MAELCDEFELGPHATTMHCNTCGHPMTAHVDREAGRPTPTIGRFEVLFSPAFLGGMGEDNE